MKKDIVYIDYENFDIYKEKPDNIKTFEVDSLIANTISTLNKKGYKTDICCQGYRPLYNDSIFTVDTNDIENLKTIKTGEFEIIQLKDKKYYAVAGIAVCRIRFDENVTLSSVPEDFDFKIINLFGKNLIVISNYIKSYFTENGKIKKKNNDEVEEDIKRVNEKLYFWALNLPVLEEDIKRNI